MEFLATLLDWFEVMVWFLAKAKGFGVVIAVVLLVLVVGAVAAVVGTLRRVLRRR